MTAVSLYLYFSGVKAKGTSGFILLGISGFALFLATNARVEYLLTFATLVLPYICFRSGSRISAFRGLIWVGAFWVILTAVLGLSTGIWSLQFMLQRSESYGAKFAADSADYLPNYIVGILFGGGLWFFALLSLARWRRGEVKIAWGGLVISMVPIALLADHTELRYYSPAIFSFALAVAIGIAVFYGRLKGKLNPLRARLVTVVLFCLLVAGNQLFRPLQEVGTDGISLVRLTNRVREKYPDPLLLTAHPHSTYAFLRICYPELRIALDRKFEGMAPLKVTSFEELEGQEEPWFYLSSRGQKDRPLPIRMLNRLRGKTPIDREVQPVIATGWVADLDLLSPNRIDREGQYLIFRMNRGGNE